MLFDSKNNANCDFIVQGIFLGLGKPLNRTLLCQEAFIKA